MKRIVLFAAASFALFAAHPDAARVQHPDQRASNRPERSPTPRAHPPDLYEVTESIERFGARPPLTLREFTSARRAP